MGSSKTEHLMIRLPTRGAGTTPRSLLRGDPTPAKQKFRVCFLSMGTATDTNERGNKLLIPFPMKGPPPHMLHLLQLVTLLWRKTTTSTLQRAGTRQLCRKQKGAISFLPVDDRFETWSSLCSTESNKLHYPLIIQRPFEHCSWIWWI